MGNIPPECFVEDTRVDRQGQMKRFSSGFLFFPGAVTPMERRMVDWSGRRDGVLSDRPSLSRMEFISSILNGNRYGACTGGCRKWGLRQRQDFDVSRASSRNSSETRFLGLEGFLERAPCQGNSGTEA